MDFARSTQAKSWMFSKESLDACRQQSLTMELEPTTTNFVMGRVRKFGSGFHRRYQLDAQGASKHASCESDISVRDQEVLIQFHAHQIQLLVGPNAIMYDLRTSENVLATAIIFFRRFYLSNSVLKVSPRRIAAACAFFAAKVEEEKIEVRSHCSTTGRGGGRRSSDKIFVCSVSVDAIFLPWASMYFLLVGHFTDISSRLCRSRTPKPVALLMTNPAIFCDVCQYPFTHAFAHFLPIYCVNR